MRVVCSIWRQIIDTPDLWHYYTLQSWGHLHCDSSITAPFQTHRVRLSLCH